MKRKMETNINEDRPDCRMKKAVGAIWRQDCMNGGSNIDAEAIVLNSV